MTKTDADRTHKAKEWAKAHSRALSIAAISVAAVGLVLACILTGVHLGTMRNAEDYISIPMISFGGYGTSSDSAFSRVTLDDPKEYLAHPDTVWVNDGSEHGKLMAFYPLGHGKGEIAVKESYDMGLTWSERRTDLPSSWKNSMETPTVYNLSLSDGNNVLMLVSGNPYWKGTSIKENGFNYSYSIDGGISWTEFTTAYGIEWAAQNGKRAYDCIVAMSSLTQLRDKNGAPKNAWMGLFHDHNFTVYKTVLSCTKNQDGSYSWDWSTPERLFSDDGNHRIAKEAGMCEVEAIRVRDTGTQYDGGILLLGRAENKNSRSLTSISMDEGLTWSPIRQLPYELCGDRHKAEYDPVTGKVIVSFRQVLPIKPSAVSIKKSIGNGWYAWMGTFEDILSYLNEDTADDSPGDALIELGRTDVKPARLHKKIMDNGYSGVVIRDGRINLVGYGAFLPSSNRPYIMSCTFDIAEIAGRTTA